MWCFAPPHVVLVAAEPTSPAAEAQLAEILAHFRIQRSRLDVGQQGVVALTQPWEVRRGERSRPVTGTGTGPRSMIDLRPDDRQIVRPSASWQ